VTRFKITVLGEGSLKTLVAPGMTSFLAIPGRAAKRGMLERC
jgi:hypothetical protein